MLHVSQRSTTHKHQNHVCVRAQPPRFLLQQRARVDRFFAPFPSLSALRSVTLPVEDVYPSTDVSEGALIAYAAEQRGGTWA